MPFGHDPAGGNHFSEKISLNKKIALELESAVPARL